MVPGPGLVVPVALHLQVRSYGPFAGPVRTDRSSAHSVHPGRSQVLLAICGHDAGDLVADANAP